MLILCNDCSFYVNLEEYFSNWKGFKGIVGIKAKKKMDI